jgi:hypothetical protein
MPTITDPAVLTLARHYAAMGGWLHATYFARDPERAANDCLIARDFVVAGWRGKTPTYEFTPAGYAWLATQEA